MTIKDIIKSKRKYRNYEFKDKKRDEDIVIVLRRHWLTFVFQFSPIIFGVVLTVLIHIFITRFFPSC